MYSTRNMERLHNGRPDYGNPQTQYWEYIEFREHSSLHALQQHDHRHCQYSNLAPFLPGMHCKSRRTASYVPIDRSEDIHAQIELLSRNWCSFLCIYSFSLQLSFQYIDERIIITFEFDHSICVIDQCHIFININSC